MALDEALLAAMETGSAPALRVYRWERPAVSFGYFEAWAPVARSHPEREPVRRWTGGGVVLHGNDWTYSVLVPRGHPFAALRPEATYRLLHEALARTLCAEGEAVVLAPEAAPRISPACFENPVQSDLLAKGRKIAGAAQRRSRFGLLHQGSVLAVRDGASMGTRFAAELAREVIPAPPTPDEIARAHHLAQTRYATAQWLRKR